MDTLLPYYENELAGIQGSAREFANRYPTVAAGLLLTDEGSGDPHIERLMQSVALLTARVAKRLDDDYAGFAEKLLDAIYPHYRRPFPACAIARFDRGGQGRTLPARTLFRTGQATSESCRFATVYPVDTDAPNIVSASFHPAGTFRTRGGAMYSGPYISMSWRGRANRGFRVFAGGDPSTAASLRDALGFGVSAVLVPETIDGRYFLDGGSIRPIGFDDEACVVADPATAHPGFRLLRELFAFSDKFGFFDVSLPGVRGDEADEGKLVLMLDPHVVGDGRGLAAVTALQLITRCAPVVNIFHDSIGFTSKQHVGSLVRIDPSTGAHGSRALIAVDSILLKADGDDSPPTQMPHFFAVRHGGEYRDGPFWVSVPDSDDTGVENVMFLGRSSEGAALGYGASINFLACDGDRPSQIVCGTAAAELGVASVLLAAKGRLITRPTQVVRFPLGKQASWRLVSHLALSQSSLLGNDGNVLKQLLHLYAPPGSVLAEQVIRALVEVRQTPVTRWLPGSFPPTLARGTEIELAFDETHLVGIGMHALVRVLDTFFSLYAQVNSFTQLVISSSHTGKELHRCALRTGTGPLV